MKPPRPLPAVPPCLSAGTLAWLGLGLALQGACAGEPGAAGSASPQLEQAQAMGSMTELARITLHPAPADAAVLRLSVRPAPGASTAGAVLLATLITGPGPGVRHELGRVSLYPADEPGIFMLRLGQAARQALRLSDVLPRLTLSVALPAAASVPSYLSVAPWGLAADWLPEPPSR